MRTQFCIYGEPRGKERPKFSTVCGHVTARTPENTVLYENLVKTEYRIQSGVRFALELDYYDDERSYPMNIIAISGRLTRDPELRTTPNGKPVVEFTVAVDRPGVKDQTDFIDCVAWEKKAEFVARYFKQGKRIEASGVLTTRTYEKNGAKRKRTEVRCDQVFFGESKKDSSSTTQAAPEPTNDDFRPLPDDDDIPF